MAGAGGSGSSGGSGGSSNKVGMLLLGAGLVAIIGLFGPRLVDGDDDDKAPKATPVPTIAVSNGAPATQVPTSAPTARPGPTTRATPVDDLRGDPNNAILTITAYGMPARVSAAAEDPSISVRQRQKASCSPDDQYPEPCVTYYVAPRGTTLKVTAGDSRAGYWPALDFVRGAGCDLQGDGRDLTCIIALTGDVEVTAQYYGGENPGLFHYQFPTCPTQRGNNPPAWAARCR